MKLQKYFFPSLSILSIFLLFLLPPVDTDLGWHLRYGDYFWSHNKLLTDNSLTYFLSSYKWAHSYSLYQILLSFVYKYFHLWGLTITNGILGILIYIPFSKVVKKHTKESYLIFLAFFLMTRYVFMLGIRAQVFSLLFYLMSLVITTNYLSGKNVLLLLFLVPISIMWVNTHGAFILIFLLVFSLMLPLVYQKEVKQIIYVFLISLLLFASTLINPFGIKIYEETIKHFYYPLGTLIAEWVPSGLLKLLIIALTFLSVVIFGIRSNKRHIWLYYLALLIPLAIISIKAKRNFVIYAATYSAFLLYLLDKLKVKIINYNYYLNLASYIALFVTLLFTLFSYLPAKISLLSSEKYFWTHHPYQYPYLAVEQLKSMDIKNKNVFSSYEWGGYLSYFDINNRHFTDGRMPAWKTPGNVSPYSTYLYIIQAKEGWENIINATKTDVLLLPNRTFLEIKLGDGDKTWKRVWIDDISSIYIRNEI